MSAATHAIIGGNEKRPRTARTAGGMTHQEVPPVSEAKPKGRKGPPPVSYQVRFWQKFEKGAPNECWEWQGSQYSNGYGLLHGGYKGPKQPITLIAHRVAYELQVGPIPEGLVLDHLCRNRLCVNPNHLEPVTMRENLLRGDTVTARHAAQTHCTRGHRFSEDNTYFRPNGSRECRTCVRELERARRAK